MSIAPPPAQDATPATRPVTDVDWRRVIKYGLLGALTAVFIAAIGMVETFDRRILIKPILTLRESSEKRGLADYFSHAPVG